MANFLTGLISLTLGVVVLSGVLIQTVKNTNTTPTGYDPTGAELNTTNAYTGAELALWGLISIAAIAGILYGTLNVFGLA